MTKKLDNKMCHHKQFGVHGFCTGHGRSIDRSRIGLLIKLAGLFFNPLLAKHLFDISLPETRHLLRKISKFYSMSLKCQYLDF